MRKKIISVIIITQIILLIFSGCGGVDNEKLKENLLSKVDYNPEQSQFDRIFFDENGEFCCICFGYVTGDGSSFSRTPNIYNVFDKKTIVFEIPDSIKLNAHELGEQFLIPYIDGIRIYVYSDRKNEKTFMFLNKNNEIQNQFKACEIEGLEDVFKDYSRCELYSIENGSIFISVLNSDNNEFKCILVDPISKKITTQFTVKGNDEGYLLKSVTQYNVIYYDWFNNKIFIYDTQSGSLKNELSLPGAECGGIYEYNGYIYMFYNLGIYKAKTDGDTFECLIDAAETNYLKEKKIAGDISVKSESQIYVSFDKGMNDDGTKSSKYFVKYNLFKYDD